MLYKIGSFAKMAQINPKQIKYYERCGLISPVKTDKETGYRFYSAEQLKDVAYIRAFLGMDFSTNEIKALLDMKNYEEAFESKERQIAKELAILQEKATQLNFYKEIAKAGTFNQDYRACEKVSQGGLAAVRSTICEDANALYQEWEPFELSVAMAGAVPCEDSRPWTRFPDKEVCFENFRAELIIYINDVAEKSEAFEYRRINPTKVVSVMHRGSYDFLHEAYAFLYMWIDKNGYIASDHPMERYIETPGNQDNPEDWITEVCIPIK